ncbi:aspartate kinase [Candidatus Caldatribacterium saccharofermentans]|uniref:Aspartokinase n=1 Tax=Candidatus Caldatribacterium saccharofermentans TaxID=1454753 RepID=A0A7V4WKZ9_9BACT
MSLVVQKYGGSSVADLERIRHVASRVRRYFLEGHRLVVVVSAMGKTTDALLAMARELHPFPPEREVDMLLATGEQVSIALLSIALFAQGVPSISLTGGQAGIITTDVHTKARILRVEVERIFRHLNEGKVVIVAGFQGVTEDGDITTLGRGGSDTTACALAAALRADVCEIYTDVAGVFTADPRIVPEARKIPRISYDEMSEMASLGAKVLQLRAVGFSRLYQVRVHVRSTFLEEEGTWVEEVENMEEAKVRAITHSLEVVKVVLLGVPDEPGVAALILRTLADFSVSLDMIIQSEGREGKKDIAFVIPQEDEGKVRRALEDLQKTLSFEGVKFDGDVGKVSVVGAGVANDPRIAFRMFDALARCGVNIDMISTSNLRISCLIPKDRVEESVQALHRTFISDSEVILCEGS